MAKLLGMKTIVVPRYAGLLSAYGILNAQVERFAEMQILKTLLSANDGVALSSPVANIQKITYENIILLFDKIKAEAVEKVIAEGIQKENIFIKKSLIFCRLKGQDATIEVDFDADFVQNFKEKYQKTFGHWIENREIEVESIRVIASEHSQSTSERVTSSHPFTNTLNEVPPQYKPDFRHKIKALVGTKWVEVPVFFRDDLTVGATIEGFALLLDSYATTVIEEGYVLTIE